MPDGDQGLRDEIRELRRSVDELSQLLKSIFKIAAVRAKSERTTKKSKTSKLPKPKPGTREESLKDPPSRRHL